MSVPGWIGRLTLVALLGLTVAACSGDDDSGDETPVPSATVAALVPVTPTAPAELAGGTLASDGICQVTVPDTWSDDGTARGRTDTNARWTLFGNVLSGDPEWATAVELLKTQQGGRPGAVIDEQPDRIVVTQAGNRAVVVRQRFADRYCELSVASTTDPLPETFTLWTQVATTLTPTPPSGN